MLFNYQELQTDIFLASDLIYHVHY